IWEVSRHQHLTVLAAAYAATGDDRYATRVARHLRSWWAANPPLRGVHWVSGIELGIRLLSWVWTRRLLDGWPAVSRLFEDNPEFRRHLYWHQRWLATFGSHGSSANNHVIAEAAGRSEEHTSELQSRENLVCRLLLEKKKKKKQDQHLNTIRD